MTALRWHAPDDTTGVVPPRLEETLAVAFTAGDVEQLGNGLRLGESAHWVCVGFREAARLADDDDGLWEAADGLARAIDKHGYGAIALRRGET